jgi:TusA-related sulfurtransferase
MIESIVTKQPLKVFKFINTRINHVNEIVSDTSKFIKSIEITSVDDMETIYNDYTSSGKFVTCNKNSTGEITKINTLENVYTYTDDYVKTVMEFEKNNNLNMFKLDYVTDYEVCNFIDHSIHFNTVCQFSNKKDLDLEHIDQKQAYTQFKKCSEYQGFLGKVTDFRKCDKEFALNNIGIYQITNINFFDDKMKQLNDKMFIYNDHVVYPSSDLLFLNKYATFDVIGGCYGIKTEFEFNEKMTNTKINGIPYYAKYTGSISSVNKYKNYYMKGTKEYFQNMLCNVDNTIITYDEKTSHAQVSYKKEYIPYKCHIASFILSYQRIHMLHQLMQMDVNKIVRIVTDGIYYDDHVFEICETFREKEVDDIERLAYYNDASYYLSNIVCIYNGKFNESMEHHKINYYKGAGGTGKTYSILTNKGYIKPLYIAPSWKLARRMRKDFKCNVTVLARVIQDTEEMFFFKSNFNVIIFDEVSQYTKNDRNIILKNFDKHKIFFVGDIGFQLPPATEPVMTIHSKWHTKEFNKVYRFHCDKLASLCEKLREFISIDKDKQLITNYVLNMYKDRCFNSIENYDHKKDYILCSKNKCNVHHKTCCNCDKKNYALQWTEKFKHLEKYLVKANSSNFCNGDITFEKVPNSFLCHAYSVHSVQGETMENKIFIDMRNLFCPQMLYTAISRARKLSQLYFITV